MSAIQLLNQIAELPPHLREEVQDFVAFLQAKANQQPTKPRVFGAAKGFFKMRNDFDEPLDDFREYMS